MKFIKLSLIFMLIISTFCSESSSKTFRRFPQIPRKKPDASLLWSGNPHPPLSIKKKFGHPTKENPVIPRNINSKTPIRSTPPTTIVINKANNWEKADVILSVAQLTESAVSLFMGLKGADDSVSTIGRDPTVRGHFLRLQSGGCLDASGTSYECTCPQGFFRSKTSAPCDWTFAQGNLNMPLHASEVRWHFDGPFLVTYLNNDLNLKRCLKFQTPVGFHSNVMEAVVAHCEKGTESERWFVKTHPEQVEASLQDPLYPKPYFSIHSEAYPEKCLTLRSRTKLVPGTFEDSEDHVLIRGRSVHDNWGVTIFYGFFLEDCIACPQQTFYLNYNHLSQLHSADNSTPYRDSLFYMTTKNESFPDAFQPQCADEDDFFHPELSILDDISCRCITACSNSFGKKAYNYNWCYTSCKKENNSKSWKYCSPYNPHKSRSSDLDYMGMPCRADYPCHHYGYPYEWCYLEGGWEWGYCSRDFDHIHPSNHSLEHYKLYVGEQKCSDRETF